MILPNEEGRLRSSSEAARGIFRYRKPVVLAEVVSHPYFHRMQGAIGDYFRITRGAEVVGHTGANPQSSFAGSLRLKWLYFFRSVSGRSPQSEYWKLGVRKVLGVVPKKQADKFAEQVQVPQTLKELESLTVNKVLIGDLIYDHYCKSHRKVSPDLESSQFRTFFRESLRMFHFWESYFNRRNVVAATGNPVYRQGMVARIAISRGIPFYFGGEHQVEKLSAAHPFGDTMWQFYPEIFQSLGLEAQVAGLAEASENRKKLIAGKLEKLPYHEQRQSNHYRGPATEVMLLEPSKPGVVILAHDHFDSTHEWGSHYFPDYFQWLKFVCQLSSSVEANWFIKRHPTESDEAAQEVQNLLEEYPHISSLPSTMNPSDLYRSGIKFGLTVNGTAASEYPSFGLTIYNSSDKTPHSRYNFSIHPDSAEHLKTLIENLTEIPFIDERELNEYFFMRWIFGHKPIFDDYRESTTEGPSVDLKNLKKESLMRRNRVEKISDFIRTSADWLVRDHMTYLSPTGVRVVYTGD